MLLGFQYEWNKIIFMLIYVSVTIHYVAAESFEELNIKTNVSETNNIDDPPEVQIESGKLTGTFFKTAKNRKVYMFQGVPYAAPPINELRFKEPHPVKPWSGKLNANKKIKGCSQFDHFKMLINPNASIAGQEDCLYLNIYTPRLYKDNSTDLLDVVVFIHGGAFMFGSAKIYTPKYLLDQMDLVFVSINYRLGPFGFMTMDDDIIPGNNGLKDQVFALKWIKNNIKQFSGDPNKVTLTGMSAGGASVHYHYLSQQSRNLFSKGISLSGLATNCWALMEEGRNKTIRLAASLGCESNNSSTLLRCLQNKTDYEILSKIKPLFMPWQYNPFSPFGPTTERAGNNPFLSENPFKMLAAGETKDAPLLLSITSDEGLYPAAEYINNNELLNQLYNDWYDIAPHLMDFNFSVPIEKHNITSKLILDKYFNGKIISTNTSKELTDLLSDRLFITDIGKATKLQAISMKSNVFMFKFSFRGRSSISNMFTRSNKNFGVSHGDDLPYILGCHFNGFEENDEEMKMVELMGNIWTSFIKYGIPNVNKEVTWHPVSKSRNNDYINYLNIKSHKETQMVEERDFGKRSFWDSLPLRENNLL